MEYNFYDLHSCVFYCQQHSIHRLTTDEYNALPDSETLYLGEDGARVVSYIRKADQKQITGLSAIFASKSELKTAALFFREHLKGMKVSGSADFTFGYVEDKGLLSPSYAHALLGSRSLRRNPQDGQISQWLRPFCRSINPTECGEAFTRRMMVIMRHLTISLFRAAESPCVVLLL